MKMNIIIFSLLIVVTITSVKALKIDFTSYDRNNPLVIKFEEFTKKYNKKYENDVMKFISFGVFLKTLDFIDHLNSHSSATKFGVTVTADIPHKKVWKTYKGHPGATNIQYMCPIQSKEDHFKIDAQFDWREKNVVTPVKNQAGCGSCWAFSAIANIESAIAIETGVMMDLSEQQIVDCDHFSYGCDGGLPGNAFAYTTYLGVESEADYPYTESNKTCNYSPLKVISKPITCASLNTSNEYRLAQKLQKIGPLSIAIDSTILEHYESGIISNANCQGEELDHAVLLVGYGEENGLKYWIIKNSWSKEWGENGYFRMERDVNCLLIMDTYATTALFHT